MPETECLRAAAARCARRRTRRSPRGGSARLISSLTHLLQLFCSSSHHFEARAETQCAHIRQSVTRERERERERERFRDDSMSLSALERLAGLLNFNGYYIIRLLDECEANCFSEGRVQLKAAEGRRRRSTAHLPYTAPAAFSQLSMYSYFNYFM